MPYVLRDKDGKIISISEMQSAKTSEFVEDNDPQFLEYVNEHIKLIKYYDAPPYVLRRQVMYPPLGEALDCIRKSLEYLRSNGIEIGPDGDAWLDACKRVKEKIPKDWKPE